MTPPNETEAPGEGATADHSPIDALVACATADPSALLADDAIAFAAALNDLDFARLRARLVLARLKVQDFARIVKSERRRIETEERERGRVPRAEDWHDALRRDKNNGQIRASLYNLKLVLEHEYGERLAFDEMAAVPLLDCKPIDDATITGIRCDLEEREDLEFSRATTEEAIVFVARERSFHPVRDYLRSLAWDGTRRLHKVAAEYLGAEDPLSSKLVTRFFVSAVARAESPGCKVDNALVLFGDEGMKKSTFFRVLGGSWFKDSKVDITDRKGMMLMHSAWIYEWPEIDRMLEKRHDSDVKAYVTQQDDSFVPMYGRAVVTIDRSNVTVGTTNKEKFITSDTGSRRWWVVSVKKRIDAGALSAERDQLWAEAVAMYDAYVKAQGDPKTRDDSNPFRWWLTEDEEQGRAERNEEHLTANPDEEAVDAWLRGAPVTCAGCKGSGKGFGTDKITGAALDCVACGGEGKITRAELATDPKSGREYVTLAEVLNHALGVPLERHHQNTGRATGVLRRLGWRSGKRIRPSGSNGPRITPYYSPEPNPEADEADTGVREAQEVAT